MHAHAWILAMPLLRRYAAATLPGCHRYAYFRPSFFAFEICQMLSDTMTRYYYAAAAAARCHTRLLRFFAELSYHDVRRHIIPISRANICSYHYVHITVTHGSHYRLAAAAFRYAILVDPFQRPPYQADAAGC